MNKKITVSEVLFYFAYIIWLVLYIIQQTSYYDLLDFNTIDKVFRIVCYLLLIAKFICDESYSIKSIIAFSIVSAIFIIISLNSSNYSLIIDALIFIYSARNINFRGIIKVTLFVQIFMMIFTISSSCFGIIENNIFAREDGDVRYSFGYSYCTYSANFYFHIVLMYLYLKEESIIKIPEVIFILVVNYILYFFTDTKAVFYLICILVIVAYSIKFIKKPLSNNLLNKILFKYCFPLSAVIAIVTSINYNESISIYDKLNRILTYRISLGNMAYKQYGISLLGQKVEWINNTFNGIYNYVDSSYLNYAINYGIITVIALCLGFMFIGKYAINKNKKMLCLILLFLAIHSITDPQLILLGYNPFMLLLGKYFSSDFKEKYSNLMLRKSKYKSA